MRYINHNPAGQDVCDNCKILKEKHKVSDERIKELHDYNVKLQEKQK